ncbi:MAG: aspartate--tRNA ligase [Helicobacter sp.]|nr:aspartate--tRNA ligase [Helicobacter sp.]
MRTHMCASLDVNNIGEIVKLCGWCQSYRDHGGVIFIDLRDKSGIIQLVIDPKCSDYEQALKVRDEFVLKIKGKVRAREEGLENLKIKTGKIEIELTHLSIQSKSAPLPVGIGDPKVSEELRLKYRYLDLRSTRLQEIFALRSDVYSVTRSFLKSRGFLEIETPILSKATPEGARDYLIPSRVSESKFYALPQSPQIYKQLLMVSGFDRYFQIAKCFRDEDLRSDRQPEFTQIDIEMSFCSENDIMQHAQELIRQIFAIKNIKVPDQIPLMDYDIAMESYGSDRPDLRFELPLIEVSDLMKDSSNAIFKDIANNPKNRFKALAIKSQDAFFSRKILSDLEAFVRGFGAQGLAYLQYKTDGLKGPILKFMSENSINELKARLDLAPGDIVFFGAGDKKIVLDYMGRLRVKIANMLDMIDKDAHAFTWIVNFPMFEEIAQEAGQNQNQMPNFSASHHPFTMPKDIDNPDILSIKSVAYDLVLNGYELGGGSMRIHDSEIQQKVFKILGLKNDEVKQKFGFLLEALSFGAPVHGGIAFGLDRIIMLLSQNDSIRDVIAFPKTQKASDLMMDAPSFVDEMQLREIHIKLRKDKAKI